MGASPNPLQRKFVTHPSVSIGSFLLVGTAWAPVVGMANDVFWLLATIWIVVPLVVSFAHWAFSRLSFEERFDWGVPYAWWSPRLPGYRESEELLEIERGRREKNSSPGSTEVP